MGLGRAFEAKSGVVGRSVGLGEGGWHGLTLPGHGGTGPGHGGTEAFGGSRWPGSRGGKRQEGQRGVSWGNEVRGKEGNVAF